VQRPGRFVGRQELLQTLGERLSREVMAPRQVIAGLGGMGKTQLAVEYAYRYRSRYRYVCWVKAGTTSSLVADYAGLEGQLGLPETGTADQRLVLLTVRRWFEANEQWLLVFDDASAPDDPIGEGPDFETLQDFLPRSLRGHVLVTTRDRTWESADQVEVLDVLAPEEAEEFLRASTLSSDPDSVREVAEVLGFLPLALEQARAYVEASHITLGEYLERLKTYNHELFDRGRPRDYSATVATTWKVSIDKVRAHCQGAADLLEVYAFLYRENIPRGELFREPVAGLTPGLELVASQTLALDAAVAELRRYSLVALSDVKRQPPELSVHRLVQIVVRQSLSYDDRLSRVGIAVRSLEHLFPEEVADVQTWTLCDRLVPHAVACVEHAHERKIPFPLAARLLERVLAYLLVRARYVEAQGHADLLKNVVDAAYGAHGADFIRALMIIGEVNYELGDLPEAKSLFEAAVSLTERSPGLEAAAAVRLYSALGLVLNDLGELHRAMDFQQRALGAAEGTPDVDSTVLARTISNLGVVHYDLGERDKAQACQERANKILGSGRETSDAYVVARRLAVVLYDYGLLRDSRTKLEEAVQYFETKLGVDHPEVGKTLHHLGFVLWDQGDLPEAKGFFERAVSIFKRSYKRPHPAVARTLAGLGMVLMDLGQLDDALAAQEEALAIFQALFGPDHFEVGRTCDKLGFVLRNLQSRVQAREQQERAVHILTKSFGANHPELAIPLSNLGLVLQELGELEEAGARHREALAIFEMYPPDHAHRQLAYSRFAVVLHRNGDLAGAREILENAIRVFRDKKGPGHPDVARGMEKLAFVLKDLGDAEGARGIIEEAHTIFLDSLGLEHPRTAISLQRLEALRLSPPTP
jgi:tetratricopeptide (TPR) repeat protein